MVIDRILISASLFSEALEQAIDYCNLNYGSYEGYEINLDYEEPIEFSSLFYFNITRRIG